jgi:hypothetical protein
MTRTTTSRIDDTREMQTREFNDVFEEQDWLSIPPSVKARFDGEGMALRWIRVSLKGKDDYQNVGKRLSEGWQFVTVEEVPEMVNSSVVREEGRYTGAICRGDLALAKMTKARAKSRQEFYENKSREMVDAVNAQLMRENNSAMPISNSSRTRVTRGRARFDD